MGRIQLKKYIRIIRIRPKDQPHDYLYRIMRTDHHRSYLLDGKNVPFNKYGQPESQLRAQTINPRTIACMDSQNFSVEECEEIFEDFYNFFIDSEYVTPKDSSKLQEDAYYVQAEHLPFFLQFLKRKANIYFQLEAKEFELKRKSARRAVYNDLAGLLWEAEEILEENTHFRNIMPWINEAGEEEIPYLPHERLMYCGGGDFNAVICEYISDQFDTKEKNTEMNDEEYTAFVRDMAQFVVNFIGPLEPTKKGIFYKEEIETLRGVKPNKRQNFYLTLMEEIENEIN